MDAIKKIMEINGGIEGLKERYVKIKISDSFMPLVIEFVTDQGPRGCPVISVAHYFKQNGDMMRDPEIEFEIIQGDFSPLTFTQDPMIFDRIIWEQDGKILIDPAKMKSVKSFIDMWNKNIVEQGFLKAFVSDPALYQITR